MEQREIKFRAWNTFHKQMFIVTNLDFQHDIANCYDESGESFHTFGFIDLEIEQFTGLKDPDRDNTEVYQGDIYEWGGLIFPITIDSFHGYRFMFGDDPLCNAYIVGGVYLGNIHENPDLIK